MSKEAKNEIDLMLRRLGRRDGAGVDSGEQHLDADELNSYVANALPSAARVRYMEHLADCTRCRGLVAQLSAAQGPIVVEPPASVPAPSGFKQFLASLLSPMVLRYAVPALGVLVIMVVGFVVMRRELTGDSVAKLSRESTNAAVSESPSSAPAGLVDQPATRAAEPGPAKASQPEGQISGETSGARPSAGAANEPPPVTTQPPATQPLAGASVAESAPPAPKAVAVQQEEAKRADNETKSEVDAVRPAKADDGTVQRRDVQAKAAQQQKAPMTETPGPTVSNRTPELGRFGTAAGVADKTRRGQRDEAADKTSPKDEGAKQQNEAAAETRSVAGRTFRKSGNVWIDTAYDSSRHTFSVRRGSEQYRALVADEPKIRRIAEQLHGEFIVVWKSRAYRIR